MADNIKQIITDAGEVYDSTGGPSSILASEVLALNIDFLGKLGKYTGFPFNATKNKSAGNVPLGGFVWGENAMNKTEAFELSISETTLDGNRFSRILSLISPGDMMHFKDQEGRSTTLEFVGSSLEPGDETILPFNLVTVRGFAENTDFAYQDDTQNICLIEFITKKSKGANPFGSMEVFQKREGNEDVNEFEAGDLCRGMLDNNIYISLAIYNGGSKNVIGSYTVFEKTTLEE